MTLEADTVTTEAPRRTRRAKPQPAASTDLSEFEERGHRPRAAAVAEDPPADEEEVEGAGEAETEEPPQTEDAPAAEDQDEAPAPTAPLARPATPPQTRPRRRKPTATAVTPEEQPVPDIQPLRSATSQALKKFGVILGNKIPGAEHFEVWKRSENGQLGYVGDYNSADLAQSQSMAAFLNRYAKPTYGPGDYQIFGITSDGKRWDVGVVRILGGVEPTDSPGGGSRGEDSTASMLMRQIERDSQRRERELREILDKKTDPTDPIDQLSKVHDLSQKLSGDAGKGEGAIVALVQAMGQQQARSDERMMQMMAVFGRKEPDPIMTALVAKMLDDKSSGPMPPMPPPVDPMLQLQGLAAVLAALKPVDTLTPILLEQMTKDRMSTADIINLVNQLRGEKGTDDFKKSMENFTGIMGAVSQMRQHTEPSAGSMWGDVIGGALSNQKLVGSVADLIRSKAMPQTRVVQAQQQPQQQQQPNQLPADMQAKATELARRRLAVEERKIVEEERRLGLTAGTPTPQPIVTPPPAATVAAQPATQPAGPVQGLPPNIVEHVNEFIVAQDDGALVEATINFLLYLTSLAEPWKGAGANTLDAINTGDRETARKYVRQFLAGLVKSNLMAEALAQRTLAAFDANFEHVVEHVGKIAEARAAAEEANEEDADGEADAEADAEASNEIEPAADEPVA